MGVAYLHGCRLRDLSAQDKLEHQRVVKDLEKNATELNQAKEERDKLSKELQVRATYSVLGILLGILYNYLLLSGS